MIKLRMGSCHSDEWIDGYFNENMINYVEIYKEVKDNKGFEIKNILNYCQDKLSDFYISEDSVERLKQINGFMNYPRFERKKTIATVLINNCNIFGIVESGGMDNIFFKDGSRISVSHLEKEFFDNGDIKSWYDKVFVNTKQDTDLA